jgi:hypothetical protein
MAGKTSGLLTQIKAVSFIVLTAIVLFFIATHL